jgi:hypothetical protein
MPFQQKLFQLFFHITFFPIVLDWTAGEVSDAVLRLLDLNLSSLIYAIHFNDKR